MISRTDLTNLIEAAPDVGVSLFLPIHSFGRETQQNPIRLKNLLSGAQDQLSEQGMPQAKIDALLAPATALLDDFDFWQNQDQGLALFLSDAPMQVHKLPTRVTERVVTGAGFHIAPLLPLLDGDAPFVVLTATAEGVAAHLATRFGMTALTVGGMPASLEALDEMPDYEGSLQSHGFGRPNTGGQSMPKTQVYGDSPEEWRKGRLVEYARRAAASLAAHLARTPKDVVVIADAEIGGHLAKSDALAPLIAGNVEVNPATMNDTELHAAGWAMMQPIRDDARDAALNRLDARLGQGDVTACVDPAQLLTAAQHGRIETLFLAADTALPGRFDPETATTVMGEGEAAGTVDLVDLAARIALQNGGELRVVEQDRLPKGGVMAAILRY